MTATLDALPAAQIKAVTPFPIYATFFAAVNAGKTPYLWQEAAADAFYEGRQFDAVPVPTGMGKTQIISAWLWAFAKQQAEITSGARLASERTVPTRLHFVVDRRIVVDGAEDFALSLQAAVATASNLAAVAAALGRTANHLTGALLDVVKLRGGMPTRPQHTTNPVTPTIAVGTIDLVVSRLLWRGYGISTSRRPIDAALVGVDSIIVLDEAHLATQAAHTLRIVVGHQRELSSTAGTPGLAMVTMSATLGRSVGSAPLVFDMAAERNASSHLSIAMTNRDNVTITTMAVPDIGAVVKTMATEATALLGGPGTAVAVFCNSVAVAQDVCKKLRSAHKTSKSNPNPPEIILIHGGIPEPVRAVEVAKLMPFATGSSNRAKAPRTIVVTTQTLEVGADIDFNHEVVQCPSIDALIQRIGRCNRSGARASGTVVVVVSEKTPGGIYGDEAVNATFNHIKTTANVGLLSQSLDTLPGDVVDSMRRENASPMTLDSAIMDDYIHTDGLAGEAPVSPWIRPDQTDSRVEVIWRDALDLLPADQVGPYLDVVRPRPWESWSIRIADVRAAMKDDQTPCVVLAPYFDPTTDVVEVRPADEAVVDVRPGCTVILPTAFGPMAKFEASGIDLSAFRLAGERAHALVSVGGPGTVSEGILGVLADGYDVMTAAERADFVLEAARTAAGRPVVASSQPVNEMVATFVEATADLADAKTTVRRISKIGSPTDLWVIFHGTLDEDCCPTDQRGLQRHSDAVADQAAQWAETLGLDAGLVETLRVAGHRHDMGKMHHAFQRSLSCDYADDSMTAIITTTTDEMLAKSSLPRRLWGKTHALGRVPNGFRHEMLSVALSHALGYESTTATLIDQTLVEYLIAEHHGHARGLIPVAATSSEPHDYEWTGVALPAVSNYLQDPTSADWASWPGRFAALNDTYKPYRLAHLETILRLADWAASEEGESR